jgi:hypothetical protein
VVTGSGLGGRADKVHTACGGVGVHEDCMVALPIADTLPGLASPSTASQRSHPPPGPQTIGNCQPCAWSDEHALASVLGKRGAPGRGLLPGRPDRRLLHGEIGKSGAKVQHSGGANLPDPGFRDT